MPTIERAGTFLLGDRPVGRIGFGAMRLAGPNAFGPPTDREHAIAVLRAAVAGGVSHLGTSDYYGPHVVNELIHEALSPYPGDLVIATKVGARRGADGSWIVAATPDDLRRAVEDNLRTLGLDTIDVVNFRAMGEDGAHGPVEGSIAAPFEALARMRDEGLIRHLGVSNVTAAQVAEARRIAPVVCVQNQYALAHRDDDAMIDALAVDGIAYVPYFPLSGLDTTQSARLAAIASEAGATPPQAAIAWLLRRAPNILVIPGTSSVDHLRENLAAQSIDLQDGIFDRITAIGVPGGALKP